jgi:hypothetical protein
MPPDKKSSTARKLVLDAVRAVIMETAAQIFDPTCTVNASLRRARMVFHSAGGNHQIATGRLYDDIRTNDSFIG